MSHTERVNNRSSNKRRHDSVNEGDKGFNNGQFQPITIKKGRTKFPCGPMLVPKDPHETDAVHEPELKKLGSDPANSAYYRVLLKHPDHEVIFAIQDLRRLGYGFDEILEDSGCDRAFLVQLFNFMSIPTLPRRRVGLTKGIQIDKGSSEEVDEGRIEKSEPRDLIHGSSEDRKLTEGASEIGKVVDKAEVSIEGGAAGGNGEDRIISASDMEIQGIVRDAVADVSNLDGRKLLALHRETRLLDTGNALNAETGSDPSNCRTASHVKEDILADHKVTNIVPPSLETALSSTIPSPSNTTETTIHNPSGSLDKMPTPSINDVKELILDHSNGVTKKIIVPIAPPLHREFNNNDWRNHMILCDDDTELDMELAKKEADIARLNRRIRDLEQRQENLNHDRVLGTRLDSCKREIVLKKQKVEEMSQKCVEISQSIDELLSQVSQRQQQLQETLNDLNRKQDELEQEEEEVRKLEGLTKGSNESTESDTFDWLGESEEVQKVAGQ